MAKRAGSMSLTARLAEELSHTIRSVVKTRSLVYPRILWRILRQRRLTPGTMRFPFGRIRYLDAASLRTTYYQIFVEDIYKVDDLGAAPTIIDCGGNIGLSVIAFKRRYPQARILTFEADPALAAVLTWNMKALGLADVIVAAQAVGAVAGHVLFQPDGAVGGRVVASDGAIPPTKAIRVPLVRLSDQMDQIGGPVDVLKMDIEGSEYDVIADLCQSGRIALVRTLICEVHGNPTTQQQVGELWRQLTEAGFRLSLYDARVVGDPRETPFSVIPGQYYAVIVYAWRP